jgi:hypothetical protein
MELSTGVWVAVALWIALFIPFAIFYIRRGRAHGHTWFTWWKPRGHSDIGPDVSVRNVPGEHVLSERVFRQTRPGADDARGARY